ncbi:hypothetical protein ACN27G_19005 [Plantactinospora sp. WMMB334]|uniref:hypothetical protein n=1 Tax=Plantactinospora sp. WMMB334 TaxID=3404119 RepID=UPI003B93391B
MGSLPYASTWPTEWTGQRRSGLLLFGTLFLGLVTAAMAAGAVLQLSHGDTVGAVIFGAIAIYVGHLAALSLYSYRGGRHRSDTTGVLQEREGVVFRYGAAPTYLLGAFLAMTTVALFLMGVVAAGQATTQGYVIAGAFGVLALFMAAFLTVFLKLAPGRVVIGPDGFHHRGLTFTHFVPWDAVVDVAALWSHSPVIFVRTIGSPATRTRNYLGRSTTGPQALSPFDTISGRWLAADPALLLQALAHYIVFPSDRPELVNGAALRRIAAS